MSPDSLRPILSLSGCHPSSDCKAVEAEVISRILRPLAVRASGEDLSVDKNDKDVGRVAAYCADPSRKPPELGTFAHFLQTIIHSHNRRDSSVLIRVF